MHNIKVAVIGTVDIPTKIIRKGLKISKRTEIINRKPEERFVGIERVY